MIKYPTEKELDEWEAQTSGEKSLTLQKGQLANALRRVVFALRKERGTIVELVSWEMVGSDGTVASGRFDPPVRSPEISGDDLLARR